VDAELAAQDPEDGSDRQFPPFRVMRLEHSVGCWGVGKTLLRVEPQVVKF
jgi:hypothetical protein